MKYCFYKSLFKMWISNKDVNDCGFVTSISPYSYNRLYRQRKNMLPLTKITNQSSLLSCCLSCSSDFRITYSKFSLGNYRSVYNFTHTLHRYQYYQLCFFFETFTVILRILLFYGDILQCSLVMFCHQYKSQNSASLS